MSAAPASPVRPAPVPRRGPLVAVAAHRRRPPRHRRVLAVALASLPLSAAAGQSSFNDHAHAASTELAAEVVRVPMDLTLRRPVVRVELDGKGPFPFVLDTGNSGRTVIDRDLREELGLELGGEVRLGDPIQPHALVADAVHFDSVTIGGLKLGGVDAVAWRRPPIFSGDDRPRGILGLRLLQDLLVTLDFPGGALELSRGELPEPDGDRVLAYGVETGLPTLRVEVAGVAFDAHIDTGSPQDLLLPATAAERVPIVGELVEVARGRTANSEIVFRAAPIAGDVRLGGLVFPEPKVWFADALPTANVGFGILGRYRVTIDQRHRRVRLGDPAPAAAPAEGAGADRSGG